MSSIAKAGSTTLDALFPIPSSPPFLCPQRFPGITLEATDSLLEILKENHTRWHIFFNEKGHHNHGSHMLLAMYQLGGTAAAIEAAYKVEAAYQRPAPVSPSTITDENFYDHLREADYWTAYKNFFDASIQEKGISAVLEKYLFSPEANTPSRRMLNRIFTGVLHPFIHVGYGCEFGLPGMVAEGLAMACVQADTTTEMYTRSIFTWFQSDGAETAQALANTTKQLSAVHLNGTAKVAVPHALELLAKIANDPEFAPGAVGILESESGQVLWQRILDTVGPKLFALVSKWTGNGEDKDEVYRKIEEIIWMNVVICGVAGWGGRHISGLPDKKFTADFFLVHLVTSVLFLHAFVPYLSGPSISALLRAYLSTSLVVYIGRGRPALPIRDFMTSTVALPQEPKLTITPHAEALSTNPTLNSWFPILQSTLLHNDNHLAKIQRALAHFDTLYGLTQAGTFKGIKGLEGSEALDGGIFLRLAGLIQDRVGWMREGEENKGWDFDGFFY